MLFTQEQKNHVGNLIIGALVVLIIFLAALSLTTFKEMRYVGTSGDVSNTLTFSGEAEIRVEPDIANISFSVEEESESVSDAQEIVSEKISVILDGLDDLGLEEKDIRTSSYTTNPRYDWNDGERKLRGYIVRQSVNLIIRGIDDTNNVIALLGGEEVSNLSGPYFEVEDEEGYDRLARKEAIAAARKKAEELASDLGVRLIRIVSFNENGNNGSIEPYAYAESASFDLGGSNIKSLPEIPTGENVITARVTITYEIQ